ncbi:MAG: hypothetical protein IT430_15715 [Phycisphaerales bacterium]|nr:hypothetical protein [Phycisphaerales bacterium]
MARISTLAAAAGIAAASIVPSAIAQVYPAQPHRGWNALPFWVDECTYQQVFAAAQFGSAPIEIHSLAFAPAATYNGEDYIFDQVRIHIGYTDKQPGELSSDLLTNPSGPMPEVFNMLEMRGVVEYGGSEYFSFKFSFDSPFCYDPSNGNLLVEFYSVNTFIPIATSYSYGMPDASRAWNSFMFGNGVDEVATRMLFEITPCGGGPVLQLSGQCPGVLNAAWSGATPNRQMGIVYARNTGAFVVPGGPCAGTALGLGTSQIQLVRTVSTGSGSGSVNGNVGPAACGGYLQLVVVDGTPCTVSNTAHLP